MCGCVLCLWPLFLNNTGHIESSGHPVLRQGSGTVNSLCGEEALSCGCLSYMLNCPELLSCIIQLAVYIDQINHKSPSPQLKLIFKTFQGLCKSYSISSWDSLFSAQIHFARILSMLVYGNVPGNFMIFSKTHWDAKTFLLMFLHLNIAKRKKWKSFLNTDNKVQPEEICFCFLLFLS